MAKKPAVEDKAMEVNDELTELSLSTFPGGVSCRTGIQTAGRAEITLLPKDSLELVEDKLHVGSDELARRKIIFRKGPWKNFFLLECFKKPNITTVADRGTAFLTDLVRVEDNVTYATFLTAGHALYSFDRVVLKHSSDLLKDGDPAASVEPFIDLRTPHNKKKGWYEACSRFTSRNKHNTGPYDFGAIFVKKEFLKMKMDEYDMSLDGDLLTVHPSNLTNLGDNEACPMFVAGYPKALGEISECTYLATSEGSYRPRKFLPKENFIGKKASNDEMTATPLPTVDVHTADTREGMSGSPIIMGEFPGASSTAKWNVIAIHVGGTKVDGGEVVWLSNAPADLKRGQGVNLARPLNEDLFKEITTPGNQFPDVPVDTSTDSRTPAVNASSSSGGDNSTNKPTHHPASTVTASSSSGGGAALRSRQGTAAAPSGETRSVGEGATNLWQRIIRPRVAQLQKQLATTDGIVLQCWTKSLIEDEEHSYLKTKKRDKFKHNEYLLLALLNNSSDASFIEFVRILDSIGDGRRYSHITRDLKAAYRKERGKNL